MSNVPYEAHALSAMILAAGKSTRLQKDGNGTPKCLRDINGDCMLSIIINKLKQIGVSHLTINTHYRADQIKRHVEDHHGDDMTISFTYEPELLGTAGAVKAAFSVATFPLLIWYGDNYSDINFSRFLDAHLSSKADATLALYKRVGVSASGLVSRGDGGRITAFVEKPAVAPSCGLVNAGIYLIGPRLLELIPAAPASDFSYDIFPAALRQGLYLQSYVLGPSERLYWIDTPDDLEHTRLEWRGN